MTIREKSLGEFIKKYVVEGVDKEKLLSRDNFDLPSVFVERLKGGKILFKSDDLKEGDKISFYFSFTAPHSRTEVYDIIEVLLFRYDDISIEPKNITFRFEKTVIHL